MRREWAVVRRGAASAWLFVVLLVVFSSVAFAAEPLKVELKTRDDATVQPGNWQILIKCSANVKSLDLVRHLKVSAGKSAIPFELVKGLEFGKLASGSLPQERDTFLVAPKEPAATAGSVTVEVGAGLAAASGDARLVATVRRTIGVVPGVTLDQVEPIADGRRREVRLTFSGPIDADTVGEHVRLVPPVRRLKAKQGNDTSIVLLSGLWSPGEKYNMLLDEVELSNDQKLNAASMTFVAPVPEPKIELFSPVSVLELTGRQLLPVQIESIPRLRCQLTRVPPFFAAEYLALAAFRGDDRENNPSHTSRTLSDSKEKEIREAAADVDNRLVDMVQRTTALKTRVAAVPELTAIQDLLFADPAQTTEVFPGEAKPETSARLSLPLGFRAEPTKGGAFVVRLDDPDRPTAGNLVQLLQITDLGVTCKQSDQQLLAWVTRLHTGEPVADAVVLATTKTDDRLVLGRTDKDGLLVVASGTLLPGLTGGENAGTGSGAKVPFAPEAAVAVTVITPTDCCVSALAQNRFKVSGVTQALVNDVSLRDARGHVFTERGIYRPGERVYVKTTVRRFEDGRVVSPDGRLVRLEIDDARGNNLLDEELTLSPYGTASGTLLVAETAPLGEYSVCVRMIDPDAKKKDETKNSRRRRGNDDDDDDDDEARGKVLARTTFMVQEFERPRHMVEASVTKTTVPAEGFVNITRQQDLVVAKIAGKYYAGGPVRSGKVKWRASLAPAALNVEGYDAWLFGNHGEGSEDRQVLESGEGILDRDGAIEVKMPLDTKLMSGLYQLEIGATVLDIDGRPATGNTSYVPPAAVKVGIHRHPTRVSEGDTLPVQVIALGTDNKPLAKGKARIEILQERWFYSQKRDIDGNLRYHWDKGWVRALSNETELVDGKATCEMGFANGGDYRIQVTVETPEGAFSTRSAITVGYGYEDDDSRKNRSPHEIIVSADRDSVKAGQKIGAEFQVPRPAKFALVCAERQGLFGARVVPLTNRRGHVEWETNAEWRPNVYLTVVVPVGRDGYPVYRSQVDVALPTVYHGAQCVKVIDEVQPLSIEIAPGVAELKARPGEDVNLEVAVTDAGKQGCETEVAVCVVDEAVLALTCYVTPSLSRLSDFILPLSVFTGDLRLSLISQDLHRLLGIKALTGGGEGSGAIASDLATRKDFRPVAFWEPMLRTAADGKLRVSFKMPDSTTTYRVYAVACDKTAGFASAQRMWLVNKEFFLKPALPRFLVAGDEAAAPVALCNKSGAPAPVKPTVGETQGLRVEFSGAEVTVPSMDQTIVPLTLRADKPTRQSFLTLEGRMGTFGDSVKLELPVMSPYAAVARRAFTATRATAKLAIDIPEAVKAMPEVDLLGNVKATVTLSATPFSRLTGTCRYLLQYPHGCVEQTSSGIIPLAGLRKLVVSGMLPGITVEEVDAFLKPGLKRLFMMQTSGGGFAYWPGESSPSWWGTMYAGFAMGMVKRAGFEMPQGRIDALVKYIVKNLTGEKAGKNFHGYGIDEMALLDLALLDEAKPEHFEAAKNLFSKPSDMGRAALIWAEALAGKTPAKELKDRLVKLNPKIDKNRYGWSDSSVREMAMCLQALASVDSKAPQADKWAAELINAIRDDGRFNSTADTGISLLALGDYYGSLPAPKGEVKVAVTQPGLPAKNVNLTDKGVEVELDAVAFVKNPEAAIEVNGAIPVHATLNVVYPDLGSRTEDLWHGFEVKRVISNLNGSDTIRVGDIVRVDIEFKRQVEDDAYGYTADYLAIEDPLPAGFVAINSALSTEGGNPANEEGDDESSSDDDDWTPWRNGRYEVVPDNVEFRDDKVLAYRDRLYIWRHDGYRYSYFARAVCPGKFRLRPTRVTLMYEPETFGLTPASQLEILPAAR